MVKRGTTLGMGVTVGIPHDHNIVDSDNDTDEQDWFDRLEAISPLLLPSIGVLAILGYISVLGFKFGW